MQINFLSDFTTTEKSPLTSGVVFIRDNARPHSAVVTQQLLENFKWDVSDHPAYIPDLATSDFHLFSELKNWELCCIDVNVVFEIIFKRNRKAAALVVGVASGPEGSRFETRFHSRSAMYVDLLLLKSYVGAKRPLAGVV
ncbi:hypothetical protein AVEN_173092-1 [Araneus ventricosus]|uniref:Histone-lysine N-methyltransferase SETMAR n=1 Tax=Araneus ventricosus TaxID=182803 RepID=A0A4Y2HRS3_ARAVE|nr:hypothetical protein AVEN_173092-1 [Araneus ventricosus]